MNNELNPFQAENTQLKVEISNLTSLVHQQQAELGASSVLKFKLTKAQDQLSEAKFVATKLVDMERKRKAFYGLLKETQQKKFDELAVELREVLSDSNLTKNEIAEVRAKVQLFKSIEQQLRVDLKNEKEISSQHEQLIRAQNQLIEEYKAEIANLVQSATSNYGLSALLPSTVRIGLKYSTAGLVVVETTGRCGMHKYRPVTYICKKTYAGMKKVLGKSKSKSNLPSELLPPVSNTEQNYTATIGVNATSPQIVTPVPVEMNF